MRTILSIPLALPARDQGGGQHSFCYELHKGKLSSFNSPCHTFQRGVGVITLLGHTRGRVKDICAGNWGEGIKKSSPGKNCTSPPSSLINGRYLNWSNN